MLRNRIFKKAAAVIAGVSAAAVILAGCGASGTSGGAGADVLSNYETSDMSGYGLDEVKDTTVFKSMTIRDMAEEMDKKSTFAIYFGADDCPWCKVILPVLNEVSKKEGYEVGYMDTRKDPAWSSNLDIDDYDKLVEKAGEYLDTDKDGKKHLYVPHIFFIKEGKIVAEHSGAVPGISSPSDKITDEQKKELEKVYKDCFDKMK